MSEPASHDPSLGRTRLLGKRLCLAFAILLASALLTTALTAASAAKKAASSPTSASTPAPLPSGSGIGHLRNFKWEASRPEHLAFTFEYDKLPTHVVLGDDGFRDQGFFLDLYGIVEPVESADWSIDSPLVYHVRRHYYPETHVLRFVFYTHGPTMFSKTALGSHQLIVTVTPFQMNGPRKLIVIDPGHGGHPGDRIFSTGTSTSKPINGKTIFEKDVVLDISLKLQKLIEATPNLACYMTRSTDTFVSLEDRTAVANRVQGDLFISIHLNDSGTRNKTAKGFEAYYLSDADKMVNRTLLTMENDENLPGDAQKVLAQQVTHQSIKDLLRSLADDQLRERQTQSEMLARAIDDMMKREGPFRAYDRGYKPAPFRVLINYRMPSVLVECGFLDNPDEATVLINPVMQEKIAALLLQGINNYFAATDPAFRPMPVRVAP